MAKSSTSSSAATSLPRGEWDFRSCPEEQLYFCFTYEMARELMRTRPAFRTRFDRTPKRKFDKYGNWHYFLRGKDGDNGESDFAEVIDAPPGFPHHPYLSLRHQITARSYYPLSEGFPFVRTREPVWQVHFDGGEFYSGDLAEQRNLMPFDFYSIEIDWSYPDSEILSALQRLLKANRPVPARKRTGHSVTRYYRHVLKELGAYRLIRARGSVKAAIALEVNGREGLFTQDHEWYTARKRTGQILADWERAFDYLEVAASSA